MDRKLSTITPGSATKYSVWPRENLKNSIATRSSWRYSAVDKYYRTRKSWADSKSQIGAYKSLENAKKEWKEGYTIYDWNGKAVYPVKKINAITLTKEIKVQLPVIKKGSSGAAVSSLQAVLGVEVDGFFGNDTETSLKVFQKNVAITADGACGTDTWTKVIEHMKANTK